LRPLFVACDEPESHGGQITSKKSKHIMDPTITHPPVIKYGVCCRRIVRRTLDHGSRDAEDNIRGLDSQVWDVERVAFGQVAGCDGGIRMSSLPTLGKASIMHEELTTLFPKDNRQKRRHPSASPTAAYCYSY
jgi:hypothetical protein